VDALDPFLVVEAFDALIDELFYQLLLGCHLMEELGSPNKVHKLLLRWVTSVFLRYILAIKQEENWRVVNIEGDP
jgi:hypothetical protein